MHGFLLIILQLFASAKSSRELHRLVGYAEFSVDVCHACTPSMRLTLLLASAAAVSYLDGNPRAAARARAVALIDTIGSGSTLPDPSVLRAEPLDWAAIAEGLLPATTSIGGGGGPGRDDEQRRSRASIEALATVARALNGARVVDPCAGKGDVALPLAHYLEREVLLCDVSERALDTASERAREAGLDTISTRLVDCAELGPHLNEDDCVVALRACGAVTDMAIAAAVSKGAAFVVSPCCLWKAVARTTSGRMPTTAPDELAYPRSEWLTNFEISAEDYSTLVDADDPPAARASAMLGDGSRTRLFRRARRILEEDRLRYAQERGYAIRLLRFEGGDNPHTGILAGVKGAEGAAALAALPGDFGDDEEPLFP